MATYLALSIFLYSLWVYLVGSIARLLYELSDAVDVLGDVWHLNRVILQVAQPLQEFRNSFTQPVHCRQTDRHLQLMSHQRPLRECSGNIQAFLPGWNTFQRQTKLMSDTQFKKLQSEMCSSNRTTG